MSLEAWQTELRRQFGREQRFRLKNLGRGAVFSEFEVTNPQSRSTYRVAIRGVRRRATTTAPARTSPPTRWAPASTSSSRWHGSSGSRGGRAALRSGLSAAVQRGRPALRRPARGAVPAGRGLPGRAWQRWRRGTSTPTARCVPEAFGRFETFLARRRRLRARAALLRRRAGLRRRGARSREQRARLARRGLPGRHRRARRSSTLLEVPLYDYQREGGPVRRPRRAAA